MASYSEDEIRRAFGSADRILQGDTVRVNAVELIWQLRKNRGDMRAAWTDSDTVTVKELREAEKRLRPQGVFIEGIPVDELLISIGENREPEYPPGTTWLDSGKPAIPWYRTGGGTWMKFGQEGTFPHNTPVRPLKRMDVI